MTVDDRYTRESPSIAETLDLFAGEWSSRLPGAMGALGPGTIPLFEDGRIDWLVEQLGGVAGMDVLELGPLEAGHTYMLEQAGAADVLSIESNSHAFLRCLVVKEVLGLRRATFLFGDFMPWLATNERHFDLAVASGVLYHMVDPIGLLAQLALASDRVFLWTHYFDADALQGGEPGRFSTSTAASLDGFTYTLHRHNYLSALELASFCGGSAPYSQWLSRDDILRFLAHVGFDDVRVSHEQRDHPHGPCFCVLAQRSSTPVRTSASASAEPVAPVVLDAAAVEAVIAHHRERAAVLEARVAEVQGHLDHVTGSRWWRARQQAGRAARRARATAERRRGR